MTIHRVHRIAVTFDQGENWTDLFGDYPSMEDCVIDARVFRARFPQYQFTTRYDHAATMEATASSRGLRVVKDGYCLAYAPAI